ncbi:MAG TPA: hypothetical protein VF603_10430 [Allosphingosinicella sp.]|jgi:hypothetical protein
MTRFSAVFALAAAAFAAAPAFATQGLDCRPVSGSGPRVSFVLAAGGGIAGASLFEGRSHRSTFRAADGLVLRQSWIDGQRVWADFADSGGLADEGRLRGSFVRQGRRWHVAATFLRRGRLYRMRCEEG